MTALTPEQLADLRERAARAKPPYGWDNGPALVTISAETLLELVAFYEDRHQPPAADQLTCQSHFPVQHRDGKPPWCHSCGMTADGCTPVSALRPAGVNRRGQWVSQDVLRDWARVLGERDQLRAILQRVADVQPVEHTHCDGSGAWLVYDAEEIKQALKGES